MKYLIVANGTISSGARLQELVSRSDRIVCADGGFKHLQRIGIIPDYVVGDMDSIDSNCGKLLKNHVEEGRIKSIQYPVKKDSSDTELAIEWAIENGATDIVLTGATGTRMDHSLSNILTLRSVIKKGIECTLIDDHNEIHIFAQDSPDICTDWPWSYKKIESVDGLKVMTISGRPGDLISIVPVTEEVTGVTLEGLEYPLDNATLRMGSSHGVSNVFINDMARIFLKSGIALVIKSSD